MKRLARSFVWWPGMDHQIEEQIKRCPSCEGNKNVPAKAPIHPWEWPSGPWTRIHIDHAGPILGKQLLIIVDAHSKWIEAHTVDSTSANSTTTVLQSTFATHGLPEQLVSDNGAGFASEEFKEFTRSQGIHHTFTSPYHPAANGLAECAVQIIKKALDTYTEGDMTTHLNQFLMRYRIIPHFTTGTSPSELLMGSLIRTKLDKIFPNVGLEVLRKQEKQKENANASHTCHHFQRGDKVFAREDRKVDGGNGRKK